MKKFIFYFFFKILKVSFYKLIFSFTFIIIIIIITPLEFFTSVLADDFSLEFEWQQVSSSFQAF